MAASTTTTTKETEPKLTFGTQFETKDLVKFDPDKVYGDWRDELHKYGCVVIKNVISSEKAKYYADKQIEWLKKFDLGFDDNDPSTWTFDGMNISMPNRKDLRWPPGRTLTRTPRERACRLCRAYPTTRPTGPKTAG